MPFSKIPASSSVRIALGSISKTYEIHCIGPETVYVEGVSPNDEIYAGNTIVIEARDIILKNNSSNKDSFVKFDVLEGCD